MELMKTLDDAWNTQDWDTFEERHDDNVAVFWLGRLSRQRVCITIVKNLLDFLGHFPTIIL